MKFILVSIAILLAFSLDTFAEENPTSSSNSSSEEFKERPLDGVVIEALETYRNPKTSQLTFDLSLLPFNAYYTGFGINAGYIYVFDKTWAWEVANGSYIYSVEKGLTSELAQNHGVSPEQIERMTMTVQSNLQYYHSYGKFILLKEYIRYFRSAFLFGVGMAQTSKKSYIGPSLGWKFEVYVNDTFSWKLEVRDLLTFQSGLTNNVAFSLGTAYSF
jgi:outer membrane beta-barrel protein